MSPWQNIYLFTYLTRKAALIFAKLQRNTYHHTMNKHKTQFSKNNTNPIVCIVFVKNIYKNVRGVLTFVRYCIFKTLQIFYIEQRTFFNIRCSI